MVSSVMQTVRPDLRTYVLDLVFGFVILPERTAFSHSVVLEASLADIGKTFRLKKWNKVLLLEISLCARSSSFD